MDTSKIETEIVSLENSIEIMDKKKEEKLKTVILEKAEMRKTDTFFDSDSEEVTLKNEASNKQQNVGKKSKKRKIDNSAERPKKKRKRFMQRNDFDSDDMFPDEKSNGEDNDEDIVFSDDDEMFSIKMLKYTSKPKKRVEINFTNEDEYMISNKEWIVSATDSSEEESTN